MTTPDTQPKGSPMRLILKLVLVGVIGFIGYQGYVWGERAWRIAHPEVNILPLPDTHVGLDSPEGQRLLKTSKHRADFDILNPRFEPQQYRSYCGVATGVIAVNALRKQPVVTQDDWFNDAGSEVRSGWDTFFGGMTLEEFSGLVKSHGLKAKFQHGGDFDLNALRAAVKANMATPKDLLVINYSRKVLEQKGWGHFSPVAGYHADSDRVLILDVGAHKYRPSWVSLKTLWDAMNTPDSDSGKNRGYAVIRL